jgi:hypothetical protein
MLDWIVSFFIDAPLGEAIVKFLTNKVVVAILLIIMLIGIVVFSGLA